MQSYQSLAQIDHGKVATLGAAAEDYLTFRPDPPLSLYERLRSFGVGLSGQRIMDLGTGTGALALQFARQGARVAGTDIDDQQICAARYRAQIEGLEVRFYTAPAERVDEQDSVFEIVTANQCWIYFKMDEVQREVSRILVDCGYLVVSHFTYLPRHSEIARWSEDLVGRYNPAWTGRNWDGRMPPAIMRECDQFTQVGMFVYDELIRFSQASWRGRMRALRGMAASMDARTVEEFDIEHAALLASSAPPEFDIPHRISAYVMKLERI
jgi:2-polyprenyl-3-methyl-5-hydroxy-6-metoxy-1,4-benzoquinol methylase